MVQLQYFLASKLAPELLGAIAVAAYSYMALVPIIQPPIMKALTTLEERKIEMAQLRPVTKIEKSYISIRCITNDYILFTFSYAISWYVSV